MKGEYADQQRIHESTNSAMFSKLNPFSQHFQLSRATGEADEEDNRSATTPTTVSRPPHGTNDGASIEVSRRPRGRPPGSKNKPKPPVIITREPEPAMSPFVLEIPGGNDIVECLSRFCSRRNIGLCVLTGSGTVANVTLRQPSTTPGATITFHGRFDILSINATFFPQTTSHPTTPNIFTISLGCPQGQIVGGAVAGGLISACPVFLIAASFNNPSYHRLPDDEEAGNSGSGGHSPQITGGGGGGGGDGGNTVESCGMSVYGSHLGQDVIWAPTARAPPPPPPY